VTPAEPVAPAQSAVHEAAEPVAVREELAPATEAITPSPARADEPGADAGRVPGGTVVPGATTESLPARGDYVYVEELPAAVREVKPEYPDLARQAGVEGPVTVFVLVGKEGRVLDAALSEKIQVPMLNEAALMAARQWVFTPGLANGRPVACWTAIPFRFRLN
jgi:protein TonB